MPKSLWIFVTALLLCACHKSNSDNHPVTNGITGIWELSKAFGGIAGVNNYPPGTGQRVQFNADGTFKGFHFQSGTYTIEKTGLADGQDILVSKDSFSGDVVRDSVRVSGNQLFITDPPQCCDMITAWQYEKVGGFLP